MKGALETLGGMKIIVEPNLPKKPKLKLSESAPVTDKFRLEFNMWLTDMFGEKRQAIRVGDVIYVTPETYQQLKKEYLETRWCQ